ncbi:hypothetical protein V6N13_102924 [Hibiscus sabdariffa]|uniref:Uncharacterized protein n=1 Tax=Hibiscus sabdariffa TaxID=183260 RepID=A0ABR2D5I1_9ROSI
MAADSIVGHSTKSLHLSNHREITCATNGDLQCQWKWKCLGCEFGSGDSRQADQHTSRWRHQNSWEINREMCARQRVRYKLPCMVETCSL